MAYHHGTLPEALLAAVEEVVNETGLEGLTLRAVARRAGVSHGAPAHHFGDKKGLLTAFAIVGAAHLERAVEDSLAPIDESAHAARLTAVGMGYVSFALAYPAHFRVSFRPEYVDLNNPELLQARAGAAGTLDRVLHTAQSGGVLSPEDFLGARFASWSMAHGYASLAVDGALGIEHQSDILAVAKTAFDAFTHSLFEVTA